MSAYFGEEDPARERGSSVALAGSGRIGRAHSRRSEGSDVAL